MAILEGAAEGVGWGPIVTLALAGAMSLLGYGDSNRRNKRAAEDIAKIEKTVVDSEKTQASLIESVRAKNEALREALAAYQLQVERDYTRKSDLAQMEARLAEKIDDHKRDVFAKVDEIKADFTRKGIDHSIKNAVAAAFAAQSLAAKGKLP